jgi:hypothetical protein
MELPSSSPAIRFPPSFPPFSSPLKPIQVKTTELTDI